MRRRRALLLVLAIAAVVMAFALSASRNSPGGSHYGAAGHGRHAPRPPARATPPPAKPKPRPKPPSTGPFAVGSVDLHLVDTSRTVALPSGTQGPRTLLTTVRYPALGPRNGQDLPHAQADGGAGPFPLIVFGHGYGVTPDFYARLLHAWASAGYVVAAPAFPLSNGNAPGGANEQDLPNQPADMSFVITRMLAADAASSGLLHGIVARHEIAVAGHSDGGDTALAAAYDPRNRDTRVGAAVILAGAEDPYVTGFPIAPGGPALLAVQGTADPTNAPPATAAFYDGAPAPKYLLQLPGASHEPPYSTEQPQLRVVEHVSIAFLDQYLKQLGGAGARMLRAGSVPGVATLSADPGR